MDTMKKKLTRAEKNELTRQNLLDAAVQVVGEIGYGDASVTNITARANIAQGTFYNYFDSRQDILDQLLPELGENLLEFLGNQVGDTTFLEREEKSLRAYFQFIKSHPEFYRILLEAQVHAPLSFARHAENLTRNYVAALRKTKANGYLKDYSEDEFETLAVILLGARVQLMGQFCFKNGKVRAIPGHVIDTFMKFIASGFGAPAGGTAKRSARKKAETPQDLYRCQILASSEKEFCARYEVAAEAAHAAADNSDFHIQQIAADLTKRSLESLAGERLRIQSTSMHISRRDIESAVLGHCRIERMAEGEGVVFFDLRSAENGDAAAYLASGQAVFCRP